MQVYKNPVRGQRLFSSGLPLAAKVMAAALLLSGVATQGAGAQPMGSAAAGGVEADGTVDVPGFRLPPSVYASDQAKAAMPRKPTMSRAWINFARTTDPSQQGLPWPRYDTTSRETMIFDVKSHVVADPGQRYTDLLECIAAAVAFARAPCETNGAVVTRVG